MLRRKPIVRHEGVSAAANRQMTGKIRGRDRRTHHVRAAMKEKQPVMGRSHTHPIPQASDTASLAGFDPNTVCKRRGPARGVEHRSGFRAEQHALARRGCGTKGSGRLDIARVDRTDSMGEHEYPALTRDWRSVG